jgi:hypothetical protein
MSDVASGEKTAGRSGAIVIRNVDGQVSVRNQSGGVQLFRIRGSIAAET